MTKLISQIYGMQCLPARDIVTNASAASNISPSRTGGFGVVSVGMICG